MLKFYQYYKKILVKHSVVWYNMDIKDRCPTERNDHSNEGTDHS